ncbi:sulfatase family protein [Puniceicoccus vermicola]|nr:sulfatase [Puniceicoccus vermicola]
MNPLNVVYLHAHDAGRYVQPYGYGVSTPNLQKLAEEGMLFRQAFCANPTCSPSRACLLSGQSAHVNGMLGLAHRGFAMDRYEDTLGNFLKENGWHTALTGVQHITLEGSATLETTGYDEFLDRDRNAEGFYWPRHENDCDVITRSAEEFLERDHEKPFFLDVGYFPPHRAGQGEFPSTVQTPNPAYVKPPAHLPDTEETRQDFANYMASVETFDQFAGRVIDAIDRNGLAENTLVIATTDHGIAFPDMKCRLTDHGTGVMLILRGPEGFVGGKVTDSMVSHLDIFPTVCDLLDLPAPDRLEGKSLKALAENPDASLREYLFSEVNVHAAYEPMRAVRSQRWKYIRHYEPRPHVTLPNCDDGLAKTYLCEHGWADHGPKKEELYDLVLDPTEANNLAKDPDHAADLATMSAQLDEWMTATDDPLLKGPLDLTGCIVTPADAYSPAG